MHWRSRTSMALRVAPVNNRARGLISTRRPGANTARSRSARSSQGRRAPGATTVPSSSSQILVVSVSQPTRTVNSGAGRRARSEQLFDRVAISTRASARRWPGVRASSLGFGSWPRASRAVGPVGLEQRPAPAVRARPRRWPRTPDRGSWPRARSRRSSVDQVDVSAGPPSSRPPGRRPRDRPAASSRPPPGRTGRSADRQAWPTSRASSRARAVSVSGELREAMTSTWAPAMSPLAQARSTSGRAGRARPRRTWRRASAFGIRHRTDSQAEAVRAPSGAQFPARSKAAVARVVSASRPGPAGAGAETHRLRVGEHGTDRPGPAGRVPRSGHRGRRHRRGQRPRRQHRG